MYTRKKNKTVENIDFYTKKLQIIQFNYSVFKEKDEIRSTNKTWLSI